MDNDTPESPSHRPRFLSNGVNLDSYSDKSASALRALARVRGSTALSSLNNVTRSLSPSERLVLYVLTILLAGSAFVLLVGANATISEEVPSQGGTLVEGIVGPARFINPVLTMAQADGDIAALVFSGLTRAMPDGSVVPDLATSYEISPDGTVYTFHLREDARFHDGKPVSAADVLFTVREAQNPAIKSPHRADWEGVSISSPDTHTIIFTLPRPYAPFIQNTTLGILPEHLWKDTSDDEFPFNSLNVHPVGSGPFAVEGLSTDSTGAAIRYDLERFDDFALGAPYLSRITLLLYPRKDALVEAFRDGEVDAVAGLSAEDVAASLRDDVRVISSPLPRVFGVFFNQSHAPVLADSAARTALDAAIDKERLVSMVLKGFGTPLDSPLSVVALSDAPPREAASSTISTAYTQETIDPAREILARGGCKYGDAAQSWSKGGRELSFTLSAADSTELTATADAVATAWRQAGIKAGVHVHPLSELQTAVIRPRSYDAILFGEVVGRELDLFAFWHSSQRNDPGLNLSLYANSRADTLLSQARATTESGERSALYDQFAGIVREDMPAVFLFAPDFLYIVPQDLFGVSLTTLTTPGERFLGAYTWYTDRERVWEIFTD